VRMEQFGNEPDNPQQLPLIIDEIRARAGNLKGQMFEIGKLLVEAKKLVRHGKFKKWIREHFEFSYPTANNFMNVYNNCLHLKWIAKSLDLSVLYQLASPKCPDDLREFFGEIGEGLKDISKPEIKSIIERFKEGEIDLESPEIKGLIKYDEDHSAYTGHKKLIDQLLHQLEELRDIILKKVRGLRWPIVSEEETIEMTNEQIEAANDLITEMSEAILGIVPKGGLVKKVKPTLEATVKQTGKAHPDKSGKKSKN
jgi:hypothetical protein